MYLHNICQCLCLKATALSIFAAIAVNGDLSGEDNVHAFVDSINNKQSSWTVSVMSFSFISVFEHKRDLFVVIRLLELLHFINTAAVSYISLL